MPRGRKVVLKAIPVQKSSAKSMSVENVMLHEEEEAERRLLNDKRHTEDDTLLDDGSASISGEEVPAPLSTVVLIREVSSLLTLRSWKCSRDFGRRS